MTADWSPAFDGQRPPFERGNDLAARSHAWSPAHVDPRADALLKEIAADPEARYLASVAYAPLLRTWAVAVARMDLYGEWLFAQDMEAQTTPPRGGMKAPIETWFAMAKTVANLSAHLGLSPLARARLGRDFATAEAIAGRQLDSWMARGAEMARRDSGDES